MERRPEDIDGSLWRCARWSALGRLELDGSLVIADGVRWECATSQVYALRFQETELELEALRSAPCGTLRIAFCDRYMPSLRLTQDLAEYRRRWPEVVLDISFVGRRLDLLEEDQDLAFCMADNGELPPGMVARPVRAIPFHLVASRDYLERHGIPKTHEDLARHEFVTTAGLESLSVGRAESVREIPLRVALRCGTMADVALSVAGGVGLALLPAALLNDPAFVNVLRPVLTELRFKESTLYLLYRSRKHLPFKTRSFIDPVLESSGGSREQARAGLGANVLRYPQREVVQEAAEKRGGRAPATVDPRRPQRGELAVVRPAMAGAH